MKNKVLLLSLIIICNSFLIFSQTEYPTKEDSTKQTQTTDYKNLIFGELGGNGGALSINYERYLTDYLSLRAGIGTGIISFSASFPIMINYSYKNLLEFGLGIVLFTGAATGDFRIRFLNKKESGLLLSSVIGFKRITKSNIFKLSLTPFYNPDGSKWGLSGGISFGFDL